MLDFYIEIYEHGYCFLFQFSDKNINTDIVFVSAL